MYFPKSLEECIQHILTFEPKIDLGSKFIHDEPFSKINVKDKEFTVITVVRTKQKYGWRTVCILANSDDIWANDYIELVLVVDYAIDYPTITLYKRMKWNAWTKCDCYTKWDYFECQYCDDLWCVSKYKHHISGETKEWHLQHPYYTFENENAKSSGWFKLGFVGS